MLRLHTCCVFMQDPGIFRESGRLGNSNFEAKPPTLHDYCTPLLETQALQEVFKTSFTLLS